MRALGSASIVLLTLLALGCRGSAPAAQEAPGPVPVIVTNHNWATVVVYAVELGWSTRLGAVETESTRTFDLPSRLVGALDFQLVVHPIGSSRWFHTDAIPVTRGTAIELTVESNLELTYYLLRDY